MCSDNEPVMLSQQGDVMWITEDFLVFIRCSSDWGFQNNRRMRISSRKEIQVPGSQHGGPKEREREERRGRSKVTSLSLGERLALHEVLTYIKFVFYVFHFPTSSWLSLWDPGPSCCCISNSPPKYCTCTSKDRTERGFFKGYLLKQQYLQLYVGKQSKGRWVCQAFSIWQGAPLALPRDSKGYFLKAKCRW